MLSSATVFKKKCPLHSNRECLVHCTSHERVPVQWPRGAQIVCDFCGLHPQCVPTDCGWQNWRNTKQYVKDAENTDTMRTVPKEHVGSKTGSKLWHVGLAKRVWTRNGKIRLMGLLLSHHLYWKVIFHKVKKYCTIWWPRKCPTWHNICYCRGKKCFCCLLFY